MKNMIEVQEIQDSTLIFRLQEYEGKERILVSPNEEWVIAPEDEQRVAWSVFYCGFGLRVKLYEKAPLTQAMRLTQEASGSKYVTMYNERHPFV